MRNGRMIGDSYSRRVTNAALNVPRAEWLDITCCIRRWGKYDRFESLWMLRGRNFKMEVHPSNIPEYVGGEQEARFALLNRCDVETGLHVYGPISKHDPEGWQRVLAQLIHYHCTGPGKDRCLTRRTLILARYLRISQIGAAAILRREEVPAEAIVQAALPHFAAQAAGGARWLRRQTRYHDIDLSADSIILRLP